MDDLEAVPTASFGDLLITGIMVGGGGYTLEIIGIFQKMFGYSFFALPVSHLHGVKGEVHVEENSEVLSELLCGILATGQQEEQVHS